jgi:hypothetical protein
LRRDQSPPNLREASQDDYQNVNAIPSDVTPPEVLLGGLVSATHSPQRIDKGVMTAISNRIVRTENMAFDCAGVASPSVCRAPTPQGKSEVLINAYQKWSRSEDYDRLMIQRARSQVADHALNRFRLSATIRQISSFDAEIS